MALPQRYHGMKKHTKEVSPRVELSKEWLMEVKHSSKAIQILSPSTTIPCSLRGTNIEALYNPTIRTSIMSEFLVKNLLGNMPLVPTNKLFKSPLVLFFECCGIARAVPVIIDKIKVFIDFHIYAILEFHILIGYPLENLIQEKPSRGGLDEKLGTIASATPIPCPKSPKAKQQPNHNPFEAVKFISPFVGYRPIYPHDCTWPMPEEVAQLVRTACVDHPTNRAYHAGYEETSLAIKGTWLVMIGFMSYADMICCN
jgi:hypothetical protein